MIRFILALIIAACPLAAVAAGLHPLSNYQVLDSNSKVMPGARLFLYDGGTSTPRIAYKDLALTTPHPNPVVADSRGALPLMYLDDGYYRQRLTTRTGTLIFDQDGIPVLTTSAGGSGTTVDPDSVFKTRDIKIRFDDQPLAGYVRLNGRTIGSAASGATERANADTQSLYEELWGFANISVTGGKGGSAAADFAANKPLVLPNAAGRGLFGMDDLGAGAQSVLTSATITNPTLPGSTGGAQVLTLAANQLPVSSPWSASYSGAGTTSTAADHQHAVVGTTQGVSALHVHNWTAPSSRGAVVNQGTSGSLVSNIWTGTTSESTGTESVDHTHAMSFTSGAAGAHSHTFAWSGSVTFAANAGGGQPLSKLPPIMTLMIFIRL